MDRILDIEVKEKVTAFFQEDGISYQAPSMKGFVITRDENGEKIKRQAKYMQMTMKEAFCLFKTSQQTVKVGMSSFCRFRPNT